MTESDWEGSLVPPKESKAGIMREAFEKAITENPYSEITHLTFADWLDENGFDDEAEHHRKWTKEWQESKDWLKELAADYGVPFEKMIGAILSGGNYTQYGSSDLQDEFYDRERAEAFWQHFDRYTRRSNEGWQRRHSPFSCSC